MVHILTEPAINLANIDFTPHRILAPLSSIILDQDPAIVIDYLSKAFLLKAIRIEEIVYRDFVVLQVQHKSDVMAMEHRNAKQNPHPFAVANRLSAAERSHDTPVSFVWQHEPRRIHVHRSIKRNQAIARIFVLHVRQG